MTSHVHSWIPAEGVTARYRCACGSWGMRSGAGAYRRIGGSIVEMKGPPSTAVTSMVTAQPSELGETMRGQVIDDRGLTLATVGRRTRRAMDHGGRQ